MSSLRLHAIDPADRLHLGARRGERIDTRRQREHGGASGRRSLAQSQPHGSRRRVRHAVSLHQERIVARRAQQRREGHVVQLRLWHDDQRLLPRQQPRLLGRLDEERVQPPQRRAPELRGRTRARATEHAAAEVHELRQLVTRDAEVDRRRRVGGHDEQQRGRVSHQIFEECLARREP